MIKFFLAYLLTVNCLLANSYDPLTLREQEEAVQAVKKTYSDDPDAASFLFINVVQSEQKSARMAKVEVWNPIQTKLWSYEYDFHKKKIVKKSRLHSQPPLTLTEQNNAVAFLLNNQEFLDLIQARGVTEDELIHKVSFDCTLVQGDCVEARMVKLTPSLEGITVFLNLSTDPYQTKIDSTKIAEYVIDGYKITWGDWSFRISPHPLVLYEVSHRKLYFPKIDNTPFSLSQCSSLTPGLDVPANAIFMDAVYTDEWGNSTPVDNCVAIYEDNSHLVVKSIVNLDGNLFTFAYVFGREGDLQMKLNRMP